MTNDDTPEAGSSRFDWLARVVTDRRLRWVVVVLGLVVVIASLPLAGRIGEVEDNGTRAFLPGSSESLEVLELQDQFAGTGSTTAIIIYQRDGGLTADDRALIEADAGEIAAASESFRVTDPVPSEDGNATLLTVILPDTSDEQVTDDVEIIREIVGADTPEGLQAKVTGPAGIGVDLGKVFEGINGRLLVSAAIVVAVLLLITYRSPFLWIIPLLVVGLADRLATAVVFVLARAFDFGTSGQSVGIMAILVFGAGTDYALLLIARYREELRKEESEAAAMRIALRQAAPAILASGGTVILGLACLLAADLNSNRYLAPVGVAGIFCALLLTLTLLPAILVIVTRRVFWPFVPHFGSESSEASSVWAKIGRWVSGNPRPIWIGTTVLLLIVSIAATQYNVSFTQNDQFTNKPEAIQGAELIAESFPAGSGAPTVVIGSLAQTDALMAAISGVEGVAAVQPAGETDDLVQFSVTLDTEPGSEAAFETVRELRETVSAVPDANALVGGSDAESLDTAEANRHDQLIVIPLVLGVVFVVLAVLLRSLLAPVLLLLTSILSTVAALGVTVLVFQYWFGYEGLQAGILLLGFVFLTALGVDYNIFLMSRVHEESPLIGTRPGMLRALSVTGGVITSAGIVLAATFAVLGILPLVALAQVGFFVAFGVLMDALLVRSVLVPAITLDLGKRIWWPSALSRKDGTPEGEAA
jgi:RND superfamily putative drug exporter